MILAAIAVAFLGKPSTSLTFVRHGETIANATGHYNARNLDTFSANGQLGVDKLTNDLVRSGVKYDRILVSPSPRALKTIAPYLKATHQKAIIWPLLYECCTGKRPANAHATKFSYTSKIRLSPDLVPYFIVQPDHDRFPNSPDYNAGLAQVDAAVREFQAHWQGGKVLIVGHSGNGGHFLHSLTGKWIKLDNAKIEQFTLP